MSPAYRCVGMYVDMDWKTSSALSYKRKAILKSQNKISLLVMAGKFGIYSNVHNVYAADLAMLRTPVFQYKGSWLYCFKRSWNRYRNEVSFHPPPGWPTNVIIFIILGCIMFYTVFQGYERIHRQEKDQKIQSAYQTTKNCMTNGTSCTFDLDADVIIADYSANCIMWKDKRLYIPGMYKLPNTTSSLSIDTAA